MFICGVFSLLDIMMGQPFDQLLKSIPVPQDVFDALVHGSGRYRPYMELVRAVEQESLFDIRNAAESLMLSVTEINRALLRRPDRGAPAGLRTPGRDPRCRSAPLLPGRAGAADDNACCVDERSCRLVALSRDRPRCRCVLLLSNRRRRRCCRRAPRWRRCSTRSTIRCCCSMTSAD